MNGVNAMPVPKSASEAIMILRGPNRWINPAANGPIKPVEHKIY